jgi:hypothetical protein
VHINGETLRKAYTQEAQLLSLFGLIHADSGLIHFRQLVNWLRDPQPMATAGSVR